MQVHIDPWACLAGAVLLLTLPLPWILGALGAAVFHEGCHLLALRLCHVPIFRLFVGPRGAQIETGPMTPGQELICALAGPLGSLSLIPLFPFSPVLAVCGLCQGIFNLLPLYPLDGGRAVYALMLLILPEAADRVQQSVRLLTLGSLGLWAMYLTFSIKAGVLPLLFFLLLARM